MLRFALSTLAVLLLIPFSAQAINPPGAPLDLNDMTPREIRLGADILGSVLGSAGPIPPATCTAFGGIVSTRGNTASAPYASVVGGEHNRASAVGATLFTVTVVVSVPIPP